jgi:hypothetical protein
MRDNVQAGPEDYFRKSITVPFLGYTLNENKFKEVTSAVPGLVYKCIFVFGSFVKCSRV